MKRQCGFTLIEVMIVVVIVAILAAVAIPSYQDSVRKTRRADAKEALMRIAALQERFFFTNNRYGTLADLGLSNTAGYAAEIDSQEGFYKIQITTDGCANTNTCFAIQATSTGAQVSDTKCKTFSLNHVGRKAAKTSTNTDNSDYCW
jgi:type IV pilus assembly protein PilE